MQRCAEFQSSPTPKGGRNAVYSDGAYSDREVSILAHPEGRAQRGSSSSHTASGRSFNPRPPRRAGATCGCHALPSVVSEFQSSPTPKGGRNLGQFRLRVAGHVVSILAHPEGRAQLASALPRRKPRRSFNPRPPRRAGATDAVADWTRSSSTFQSSPTPKGGRNLHADRRIHYVSTGFNPRPPRRAGATGTTGGVPDVSNGFQSSPTPKGGRNPNGANANATGSTGFNPRPPRRAGATTAGLPCQPVTHLFQSSPTPKGGRNPANSGSPAEAIYAFQSSPTPKGGRNPLGERRISPHPPGFNPRPPRRAGATAQIEPQIHIRETVSILAHPEGRAQQYALAAQEA